MKPIRFTQAGYEKLKAEYEDLKQKRPATVEDLKKAREMGDLSENGYYKASKAKLAWIDGQIFRISHYLKMAQIVEEETEKNTVSIGKTVTLTTGTKKMVYAIVGDMEANPSEGKISLLSPLGRALIGQKTGAEIALETPSGKIIYKITSLT